MAYPRSRSFRYFGTARGPVNPRSSSRPVDPDMSAIFDKVLKGELTPEQGAAELQVLLDSRKQEK